MRIAILGTRGVPAAYGGFETFAEELGARLVARGHEVTVYGRSHVVPRSLRWHRGIRLRVLPTLRHKYLDTVAHTALSALDSLLRGFDVVLVCNSANAPFAIIPRLTGAKVALNVDGLEWERDKWGRIGRAYYRSCARLAAMLPITLVSDARVIANWYRNRFGRETVFIPYGSDPGLVPAGSTLDRLGLEPDSYVLYVSRLEPENNAHLVIEAFSSTELDLSLVVVGDAPYASEYRALLDVRAARDPRVRMTGYIFGDGYAELQSNCAVYVQATEVGGTHPALVEAMGRGACIVANDVPEHREVLGHAGCYYARGDPADLARVLTRLLADRPERERLGAAARARAEQLFSWSRVCEEYESLFGRMVGTATDPGSSRHPGSD